MYRSLSAIPEEFAKLPPPKRSMSLFVPRCHDCEGHIDPCFWCLLRLSQVLMTIGAEKLTIQ